MTWDTSSPYYMKSMLCKLLRCVTCATVNDSVAMDDESIVSALPWPGGEVTFSAVADGWFPPTRGWPCILKTFCSNVLAHQVLYFLVRKYCYELIFRRWLDGWLIRRNTSVRMWELHWLIRWGFAGEVMRSCYIIRTTEFSDCEKSKIEHGFF